MRKHIKRKSVYKALKWIILLFVIVAIIVWTNFKGHKIIFDAVYKEMVRETIVDMVKPESLRYE